MNVVDPDVSAAFYVTHFSATRATFGLDRVKVDDSYICFRRLLVRCRTSGTPRFWHFGCRVRDH